MAQLTDLAPRFFVTPWLGMPSQTTPAEMQDRRRGMGLSFNCCCGCGGRLLIAFPAPLDGGPPAAQPFDVVAHASLGDERRDGWNALTVDAFNAGAHGRWLIDRGTLVRIQE